MIAPIAEKNGLDTRQLHLPASLKKVVVILIKPSSYYHKDQWMLCGWRQIVPCNSLHVLYNLTKVALLRLLPKKVAVELHMLEEGIGSETRKLEQLKRRFPEEGSQVIVGLVGVQTAQFPRACDVAIEWQRCKATVVIGGFHVSGSIATMEEGVPDDNRHLPCPGVLPREIQMIIDNGVVVFHGEAEDEWEIALADILQGQPKQIYRGGRPNLNLAPMPYLPKKSEQKGYMGSMAVMDTSRGCPFACSFCSIINVQGRTMRFRNTESIVKAIEGLCKNHGRANFFFTDDNFARNPHWEEILDGLTSLRKRGHKISFMIEADLACGAIPHFLAKLASAGCHQIFMGVESMNPANLREAHKYQNQVAKYRQLWDKCHSFGLTVHAGYIIGFAHDTPASVKKDVQALQEYGADIASFFMLTPIPGSEDHLRAVIKGVLMDDDLNRFDSFQAVTYHPLMSREQWQNTYHDAWRQFYTVAHMRSCLQRCKTKTQREKLQGAYLWYCWAIWAEDVHPMNSPFIRLRFYRHRRPNSPRMPYWKFLLEESWRYGRYVGCFIRELRRFQQVNFPLRQGLRKLWQKYSGKTLVPEL